MEKARIRWGAADAANCKLTQCEDCRTRSDQGGSPAGNASGTREALAQENTVLIVLQALDRWAARQMAGPKSMVRTFPSRLAYSL